MGKDNSEKIMARVAELDLALDSLGEELEEAKKKKKPYDSATITTGNIGYNLDQFNKHMGTAFPGNDNNNPSTEEAKAAEKAAAEASQDLGGDAGSAEGAAAGDAAASAGDGAGDAGAAGDGGAGMGESLMEGAIIDEERILIPKLVKNGVAENKAFIELPDGVHVLDKSQVIDALTKLNPAEEFVIGYITPIYFYKELWDLFNVVKCTEFIGYTGMDYRQVRDETRAEYDADREDRLQISKNQIDNPADVDNQFVKRIDSQKPKAYGAINKTVVQKNIDNVNYDSILYYPAPGQKPKVCYYIDIHDGKGYAKVSRALFEKTVIAYVERALANNQLVGSNRWNIDRLAAKIRNTLAVDNATTGKDALGAQQLYEPTAADNQAYKPQVRALYTNQVYYLKTPYDTLGEPLNPSLLEDVELDEAKRETRRYYIRPQGIFCANKAEVIRGLISVGDENCCVYSLKGLGDNRDVHKLTNKDIIYYYDDGVLYDKNHVKVMDYDLYIKHEEERKKFPGDVDNVSGAAFIDEYDDRITDVTGPGIEESLNEDTAFELKFEDYNAYGEKLEEDANYKGEYKGYSIYKDTDGKYWCQRGYTDQCWDMEFDSMSDIKKYIDEHASDYYYEDLNEAKEKICCICGEPLEGYGNNPEPYKHEGRCCDACNLKFVIPARLDDFNKNID